MLHPLKSELNFPYGPKEPLDGSSPRAFRWVGAKGSLQSLRMCLIKSLKKSLKVFKSRQLKAFKSCAETLPMHLFEALFLAQAVLKSGGKLPRQAEAQLGGAQGTRYKATPSATPFESMSFASQLVGDRRGAGQALGQGILSEGPYDDASEGRFARRYKPRRTWCCWKMASMRRSSSRS